MMSDPLHPNHVPAPALIPAPALAPALLAEARQLHSLFPRCTACHQPTAAHTYRFFACHPAAATLLRPPGNRTKARTRASAQEDLAAGNAHRFLAAISRKDLPEVLHLQRPALGITRMVVYAIACPGLSGGMLAVVLADPAAPDAEVSLRLFSQQSLPSGSLQALRDLCPGCAWLPLAA